MEKLERLQLEVVPPLLWHIFAGGLHPGAPSFSVAFRPCLDKTVDLLLHLDCVIPAVAETLQHLVILLRLLRPLLAGLGEWW